MTDLNDVLPKRQREAFLSEPTPSTLRALFAALLKISTDEAKPVINRIAEKINKEGASALGEGIPNADKVAMVLQKLNSQYEGGACASFLLFVEVSTRNAQILACLAHRSS